MPLVPDRRRSVGSVGETISCRARAMHTGLRNPIRSKRKNRQKHVLTCTRYSTNNVRIIPGNVPLRKSVDGIFMSRRRRKLGITRYW